jgi:signal transduction histidine kinase
LGRQARGDERTVPKGADHHRGAIIAVSDTMIDDRQDVGFPVTAEILTHRMLGARLYLHILLRWAVAVAIILGAVIARNLLGVDQILLGSLVIIGIIIALYNSVAWVLVRGIRHPDATQQRHDFLRGLAAVMLVADYLALTAAIWLTGGARSPFLAFYLLHVTIACLLHSRRAAVASALIAYALLASLIVFEMLGGAEWLPQAVTAWTPLEWRYGLALLVAYGFLIAMTTYLLTSLAERIRRTEQLILDSNMELDRICRIRRDFLHIATHNVRAPVGAAIMILRNLRAGMMGELAKEQRDYVRRAEQRLEGLTGFFNDLQTLESLDSEPIEAASELVDLIPMLEELLDAHADLAANRSHALALTVPESLPPVKGVARLIREAVANYIRNAIKYTPDGGRIEVRARPAGQSVRIEVRDNGVGILEKDVSRVFEDFQRVTVNDPTLRKAQGSGLGLSITRRVVEAHGGVVGVESRPGEGSTFYLELPVADEAADVESTVGS